MIARCAPILTALLVGACSARQQTAAPRGDTIPESPVSVPALSFEQPAARQLARPAFDVASRPYPASGSYQVPDIGARGTIGSPAARASALPLPVLVGIAGGPNPAALLRGSEHPLIEVGDSVAGTTVASIDRRGVTFADGRRITLQWQHAAAAGSAGYLLPEVDEAPAAPRATPSSSAAPSPAVSASPSPSASVPSR